MADCDGDFWARGSSSPTPGQPGPHISHTSLAAPPASVTCFGGWSRMMFVECISVKLESTGEGG